ncbi:hypothetical protein GCM10027610_085400 [Dactylosporangium cerinum]
MSTARAAHRVYKGVTFEEYAFARTAALVRFARLLTGDEHRAEDLVQDVLARAYARWGRISRTDRPDVYVRRMLVNAHHSWWRRRSSGEVSVAAPGSGPPPRTRRPRSPSATPCGGWCARCPHGSAP